MGNRLPLHSANLWTKFEFPGVLRGLSLGTGVRVVSQREGDVQNSFQLPGYVTWDAAVAYKFKVGRSRVTAQLNANNLLDKRYFGGTDLDDGAPRINIIPGTPLSFIGSLRLEF